jgi:biotin carboxylase
MSGSFSNGHFLIIHRWINGPADYASYVDHGRAAVSYLVTERSGPSVPAAAAATAVVGDTADLTQVRAAARDLVAGFGVPKAVIALQEGDLAVAAALREQYGCPGPRRADLHHFLDKLAMLDAATAAGADVPAYRVVRSATQLSLFAEQAGWPLVVKPLSGRGSVGVRLVTGEQDALDAAWSGPMLAQRHVALPVYHADGYYDGERIGPWRLARYVNIPANCAHGPLAFNSGEPVGEVVVDDPARVDVVRDFLRALIPRLAARAWIFHIEFFLDDRADPGYPIFLEVGCRPGGGEIPFSWREVYDVDLLRLEFGLQCGLRPRRPRMRNRDRIAGSLLVPLPVKPPMMITDSTSMLGAAGPYAEVLPATGATVTARAGYELVGGRFRFSGSSTEQVTRKILRTAQTYQVTGEPLALPRPMVLLIGGSPRMPLVAADLGARVLAIHRRDRLADPAYRVCEEVVSADLLDTQAVVAAAAALCWRHPVARVVSTGEDGLLPAARVNELMGYGGNPLLVVQRLKDKARLRRCLAEAGLSPVRHQLVASASELSEFADAVGGAVIVKPVAEGGSKGVQLVSHPVEASVVWRDVVAAGREVMLAEEYLSGREVSVEAFSAAGRHTVIAITDKQVGQGFVETGHVLPAALGDDEYAAAAGLTRDVLDAVGLVEGPSHTEIMLTRHGPRIIESHNRIGGDRIADLVRAVYAIDLERLTIGVPLGLMGWDGDVPAATGGAAVRFLTPPPGLLTGVSVPPAGTVPGATATVTVQPGAVIPPLSWSGDRVAGNVFATGRSAVEALARADALAAAIVLTTRRETGIAAMALDHESDHAPLNRTDR